MKKKICAIVGIAVLLISTVAVAITPFYLSRATNVNSTTKDSVSIKQEDTTRQPGGTVSTSIGFAVDNTFHPLGTETTSTGSLMSYMFDPLVVRNPYQPAAVDKETGVMAKTFNSSLIDATGDNALTLRNGTKISDNTTTVWSIELRHGYYWHDGAEITADDLVFTYQFSQWVQNHYKDATTGMGQMEYYKAVKTGKYSVKVYTGREGFETARYPLYKAPYPKHIYGKASTWKDGATGTFNIDNQWKQDWDVTAEDVGTYIPTLPDDPVLIGSGPWSLTLTDASYPPNVRNFVLERNPNYYWNPYNEDGEIVHEWKYFDNPDENNETIWAPCEGEDGNPYLYGPYADRLKVSLITEETLEWQAFTQGGLSFAQGTSVTRHLAQVQARDLPLYEGAEWGMNSLHFFADSANYFAGRPQFRRAMDWALDKYEIINEHRNGYGYALNDPISSPPWGPSWNWEAPVDRRAKNTQKARQLLLDMPMIQQDTNGDGFVEYAANGSNIEPLKFVWIQGYNKKVGTLCEQYMEAAGVPVDSKGVPMSRAWELTGTPGCHACPYGWGASANPVSLLIIWAKPIVAWSEYGYYNQTYADAVETMLEAKQVEDAYGACHTAQEYFFKDVPSIPMFRDVVLSTWHSDKWDGVVTGTDSYIYSGYSSRFMIQRAKTTGAEGFSHEQNARVEGTADFGATVKERIIGDLVVNASKANISFVETSIDGGASHLASYEVLNVEPLGNFSAKIKFKWDYQLDTTTLENGKHQLTLRVFGLTGEPLKYYLLFNVDNSVPLTQRVLPMVAITGVITAIIVGAISYTVFRGKKPPKE